MQMAGGKRQEEVTDVQAKNFSPLLIFSPQLPQLPVSFLYRVLQPRRFSVNPATVKTQIVHTALKREKKTT